MCGICGYISKLKYDEKLLEEMNNTLLHRGPDDSGLYLHNLDDSYYAGIAQRRLSILDLTKQGHQPMFTSDGKIGIVYNGEIYNYKELREDLKKRGYDFRSSCDTEVLLYLYQEYGIDSLQKLNGMFAFAVVDFGRKEVILARDRIGKKPLYYYTAKNGDLVFGSELKPVLKFPGFCKEIRREIISRYLCYKYINSPDTIFRDTYKVEPGQYIIWKSGTVRKEYYWNLLERYQEESQRPVTSYQEAKNHLTDLLYDAVAKRMVADVPVGTFLSGGIDSTLVTAIAKDVGKKPVKTFTIGFPTRKENEAEYAKAVARYLGTDHREYYISGKELMEQIRDMVRYYDEPFADSSQIPMMLVSQIARRDTTVMLSGDGGDELFCGYEKYDWAYWAERLDALGGMGYALLQFPGIRNLDLLNHLPDKARAFVLNRDKKTKVQLFTEIRERHTKDMVLGKSENARYGFEADMIHNNICRKNWQMRRMLLDMKYDLPDDILTKTDRASMRYSLEIRCPILDYRIAEYSFRLPQNFKYHRGDKKHVLKDITYDFVPRKLLDRPKKGFGVPLAHWLRNELYDSLLNYARKDVLKRQGIFHVEKIHEFIQKLQQSEISLYNSVLWSFYVFQMWYQEYVEDMWNS